MCRFTNIFFPLKFFNQKNKLYSIKIIYLFRFFAAKHLSLAQQTSLNSDIALRIENTNTKNEKVAIESKENETSYRKEENSITDVSCR